MPIADTIFAVLFYINLAMVVIVTISFIPQFLFYLFFFLRRRHFRPAKTKRKVALLICAHNEESVIEKTVTHLLNNMNYPKDMYKIYVCAHNCTDRTAELAKKAGATVYVLNDDNPKHRVMAYPLKYGFTRILEENKEAEIFMRVDADNILHPDYFERMNDSFEAGCKIVRGYEASINLTENLWTEQSGIFYYKDSRVQNTFRQALRSTAMSTGPGLTFHREIVERMEGWDCMTACEDAEFCFKRLYDGYKIYFNTDAIVYEDQPATFKDTYNRLVRLGHSLNRLFFTDGWRMLVMFFKTGRPMYLDMLLQIAFNPVSVICFVWFPLYYIAYAIVMLMQLAGVHVLSFQYFELVAPDYINSTIPSLFDRLSQCGSNAMMALLMMAVQVIAGMFIFCIVQSFIAVFLDRKKNGIPDNLKGMWKGILLSPIFTFVYGICNCIGCITTLKWKVPARTPESHSIPVMRKEKSEKLLYVKISQHELERYDRMSKKSLEKQRMKKEILAKKQKVANS